MCADSTELTYEAMLTDPLIRLVMQSDGVSHEQLVSVLREAAAAVHARAELLPMRPRPTLVHTSPPRADQPPRQAAQQELQLRVLPTGT